MFALLSAQPAAIARLTATDARRAGHSAQGGPVAAGATANLCVFDPAATTVVDPSQLASRSRNTPYAGRTLRGAVRHTVLRGEPVVIDGDGPAVSARVREADQERRPALLVTADGTVFTGEAAGAEVPVATGELVFNTAMSGYQEVITDPSYAGQVIAFTCTHIGNYGTNAADDEAAAPRCRGVVVRDLADEPSNWRSTEALEPFLRRHGVPALTGVDTRRLTRHLRDRRRDAVRLRHGARGRAARRGGAGAGHRRPGPRLGRHRRRGARAPCTGAGASSGLRVVAYDFGVKATMVRLLAKLGRVTVVPAGTTADEVLASSPTACSSPTAPATRPRWRGPTAAVADLVGRVPIFGICLGHQILATALGGTTYKLPFGHHGANHPVQRLETGVVEITSQNHNYAVAAGSIPGARGDARQPQRRGDRGLPRAATAAAFSVQYHPEAAPGPTTPATSSPPSAT